MVFKILGHRGINQPENKSLPYQNTMEAFTHALNCGADGLELDVWVSKSGACHVIHDNEIAKHGGTGGLITELSDEDINKQLLWGKFRIPQLREVLELFKKENKFINIEMKQEGIAEQVIAEVLDSGIELENILISSFNHHDLSVLRGLNKDVKIGLLFGRESRENKFFEEYIKSLAERLAPIAFNMEKTLPYLYILESPHEKYIWTIKKEDMETSRVAGLQMYENVNLITDYPEELRAKISAK